MHELPLITILKKRSVRFWLYSSGTALLLLGFWLQWSVVSVQPERVFWGMIDGSLSTQGVTLQLDQKSSNVQVTQRIQYSLGPTIIAHNITTIKQGSATVVTELVGNATKTYSRYIKIDAPKNAKKVDLKPILEVWADAGTGDNTTSADTQLLAQAAIGLSTPLGTIPVPIANLNATQRSKLLQQIRDEQLYQVSYGSVKKQHQNGRLLYTYDVKMQPILYVDVMKAFATSVGLHYLDKLDANSYSGAAAITTKLTVDAHSRQLVAVNASNGYTETYSGYDIPTQASLPKHAISSAELQKRLSKME